MSEINRAVKSCTEWKKKLEASLKADKKELEKCLLGQGDWSKEITKLENNITKTLKELTRLPKIRTIKTSTSSKQGYNDNLIQDIKTIINNIGMHNFLHCVNLAISSLILEKSYSVNYTQKLKIIGEKILYTLTGKQDLKITNNNNK